MEGSPLTRGEVARVLNLRIVNGAAEGQVTTTSSLGGCGQQASSCFQRDPTAQACSLEVSSALSHGHSTGEAGTLLPLSHGSVAAHTHTPSVLEWKAHR